MARGTTQYKNRRDRRASAAHYQSVFPDNPWMTLEAIGCIQAHYRQMTIDSVLSLTRQSSSINGASSIHCFQVLGRSNSVRVAFLSRIRPRPIWWRVHVGFPEGYEGSGSRMDASGSLFPVTAQAPPLPHATRGMCTRTNGGDLLERAIQVFCLLHYALNSELIN
jgi:hypothetical protein